jgi:hypothetical protein
MTIAPLHVRMAMTTKSSNLHSMRQRKVLALLELEEANKFDDCRGFLFYVVEQPPSVEAMLVNFLSLSLECTVLARTALLPPLPEKFPLRRHN